MLDTIYVDALSPVYASEGYETYFLRESSVLSWISLFLFVPLLLKLYKMDNLSSNIIVLLFLVSYVPMTSMMAFVPTKPNFLLLYSIYWGALLLLYLFIPKFSVANVRESIEINQQLWIIIVLCIIAVVFVSGYYFGFRITLDLDNVYELREEVAKSRIPAIFNYILPAAGNFLPIVLVYFIDRRNTSMIVILGIVLLLNFSIGGHKAIFYKLILAFIGYIFLKRTLVTKYVWFLSFLVLIALIEYKYVESYFVLGFGVRRLLYVPALLNYQYFDFFSSNELDYYRQSFMRYLGLSSPYNESISLVIGNFMGNPGMGANNGLFSDAYANLGVTGVILHPLIIVVLFKSLDKYSYGIDNKYLFLIVVACATVINSSFLPTGLLTHGILFLMVILYLFPRTKKSKAS